MEAKFFLFSVVIIIISNILIGSLASNCACHKSSKKEGKSVHCHEKEKKNSIPEEDIENYSPDNSAHEVPYSLENHYPKIINDPPLPVPAYELSPLINHSPPINSPEVLSSTPYDNVPSLKSIILPQVYDQTLTNNNPSNNAVTHLEVVAPISDYNLSEQNIRTSDSVAAVVTYDSAHNPDIQNSDSIGTHVSPQYVLLDPNYVFPAANYYSSQQTTHAVPNQMCDPSKRTTQQDPHTILNFVPIHYHSESDNLNFNSPLQHSPSLTASSELKDHSFQQNYVSSIPKKLLDSSASTTLHSETRTCNIPYISPATSKSASDTLRNHFPLHYTSSDPYTELLVLDYNRPQNNMPTAYSYVPKTSNENSPYNVVITSNYVPGALTSNSPRKSTIIPNSDLDRRNYNTPTQYLPSGKNHESSGGNYHSPPIKILDCKYKCTPYNTASDSNPAPKTSEYGVTLKKSHTTSSILPVDYGTVLQNYGSPQHLPEYSTQPKYINNPENKGQSLNYLPSTSVDGQMTTNHNYGSTNLPVQDQVQQNYGSPQQLPQYSTQPEYNNNPENYGQSMNNNYGSNNPPVQNQVQQNYGSPQQLPQYSTQPEYNNNPENYGQSMNNNYGSNNPPVQNQVQQNYGSPQQLPQYSTQPEYNNNPDNNGQSMNNNYGSNNPPVQNQVQQNYGSPQQLPEYSTQYNNNNNNNNNNDVYHNNAPAYNNPPSAPTNGQGLQYYNYGYNNQGTSYPVSSYYNADSYYPSTTPEILSRDYDLRKTKAVLNGVKGVLSKLFDFCNEKKESKG